MRAYSTRGVELIRILLVMLLFTGTHAAAQEAKQNSKQLRVGVEGTYPPFSHRNIDGEFSGLDIDIANALCKIMKSRCTFRQIKWNLQGTALRAGEIDMAFISLANEDQRGDVIEYSRSYLTLPGTIVVHKNSLLIAPDPAQLTDVRLGVLTSSPHSEYLAANLPDVAARQYDSEEKYFLDLANGRLDGVFGNGLTLSLWLKSEDGLTCCRMLGTLPYDADINGPGSKIAVRKQDEKLLKNLNRALDRVRKSGALAKIVRTYLPFIN